jgi:hypothetical protein
MPQNNFIVPLPGTDAHEAFMRKAKDPNSLEGQMAAQMTMQASEVASDRLRSMLHHMIEIVPGQLFRDVSAFHEKFALPPTDDPNHQLTADLFKFRAKFLFEEFQEYCAACGYDAWTDLDGELVLQENGDKFDPELALDSLLDSVYVALGTAYLHRFLEVNEAWRRIQEKNMEKVRAVGNNDPLSVRKHSADVVKPIGWRAASLVDLLDEPCAMCDGTGEGHGEKCVHCGGKGYSRRKPVEDQS